MICCGGSLYREDRSNSGNNCEIVQIVRLPPGNMSYRACRSSLKDLDPQMGIHHDASSTGICLTCAIFQVLLNSRHQRLKSFCHSLNVIFCLPGHHKTHIFVSLCTLVFVFLVVCPCTFSCHLPNSRVTLSRLFDMYVASILSAVRRFCFEPLPSVSRNTGNILKPSKCVLLAPESKTTRSAVGCGHHRACTCGCAFFMSDQLFNKPFWHSRP